MSVCKLSGTNRSLIRERLTVANHIGCRNGCETALHGILLPARQYRWTEWISMVAPEFSNGSYWHIFTEYAGSDCLP
jgi:hypothetical protein